MYAHGSARDVLDEESGGGSSADGSRREVVRGAAAKWRRDLADVSGRNALLFFKDLKAGTLDLADAEGSALRRLLDGADVRLSDLFPAAGPAAEVGSGQAECHPDALKRVRTIRKKAVTYEQELGLSIAHVAYGMATWADPDGAKVPAAPVLLLPVRIEPVTVAHRDFLLSVGDDPVVNPVLLHYLRHLLGVDVDVEELGDAAEDGPEEALRVLDEQCRNVPGWCVGAAVKLANFSYAKQPLVEDLTEAVDLLASHDVVAALAGDSDAMAAVRPTGPDPASGLPDRVRPEDEFLVLDADSSQSQAINAVLDGRHLVIQGPPGTGKSQTIANLIASLVANGRTVLFVAEKRAAIDAVLGRLEGEDLGHLVMDLHDGGDNRRRNAQALAESLDRAKTALPVDVGSAQAVFERSRGEVARHARDLHGIREPWGVSLYEAQVRSLPGAAHASPTRIRGQALARFDRATIRHVAEQLGTFADLGGFSRRAETHPWLVSPVTDPRHSEQLLESLAQLRESRVPDVHARLAGLIRSTGLRPPASLREWQQVFLLLDRAASVSAAWRTPLDEVPLDDLLAATATAAWRRERGVRIAWGDRRRLVKRAREMHSGPSSRRADLHAAIGEAVALREEWNRAALAPDLPRVFAGSDDARAAYDALMLDLRALAAWIPGDDPDSRTLEAESACLERLWDDSDTLRVMPQLNRIREELVRLGLGPLLDELTRESADAQTATDTFEHVLHASIVESIAMTDPTYGSFTGASLTRTVGTFIEADRSHIDSTPDRVRRAAAERLVAARNANPAGDTLLRREAAKRSRLLPIRILWLKAPDILLGLRPCWAMSPLVVSQVLPRETLFDVVIFDEASQVVPADAVPAIMRARQLVVAGDVHQLPPTSFFASSGDGEDEPTGADGEDGAAVSGFESLLDLARTTVPERTLT